MSFEIHNWQTKIQCTNHSTTPAKTQTKTQTKAKTMTAKQSQEENQDRKTKAGKPDLLISM